MLGYKTSSQVFQQKNEMSNENMNSSKNVLHFHVSFKAKDKSGRVILDNITEAVESGQTLAIMGPSGAGKTTLLRVLTKEAFGGISSGSVTLNGEHMTSQVFKKSCGLVSQEDYHWTFLTCRETLLFTADLLKPHLSQEEKNQEVDLMLERTGLTSCMNTIVGNQFIHGLSGGQKRRLSVAVALMKKLDVIFLDEPTTGLDSAASAGMMVFLAEVTKRENLITIFTIHQPSTAIFNSFDRILLLSKSRTAYCGTSSYVYHYLETIGFPLPDQMNPAEHLLDIINADFTSDETVKQILDKWDIHGKSDHIERIKHMLSNVPQKVMNKSYSSLRYIAPKNMESFNIYETFRQTTILMKRQLTISYRDPLVYTGRMFMILMSTVFFAVVYIHARTRTQAQALQRFYYILWCVSVPTNLSIAGVYLYNIEYHAIKREVKNGMLNVASYLTANSIIQIPVMFLFALSALPVAAYGMINFQGAHFGQMLLIYAIVMYVWEAFAQYLSVAFNNAIMGMMQFMNIWFTSFLFCGLFLAIDDIVWPFRVFSYILPYKYLIQILTYQEFEGTTFRGAELCDSSDPDCLSGGYKCDAGVDKCYGYTGSQVLQTIHGTFSTVTAKDLTGPYIGILLAMAFVCKVGYFITMKIKVQEDSEIDDYDVEDKENTNELRDMT